jgi:hypothetical protein
MNTCRQTRSPRLLYLALAVVVLGLTAPPLPAQGTGKRVIELRGADTLGIGTSPSKAATAKVGQDLLALYVEYQAYVKDTSGQGAAAPAFKSSNAIAPVAGGSVVIDATASGDAEALAAARANSERCGHVLLGHRAVPTPSRPLRRLRPRRRWPSSISSRAGTTRIVATRLSATCHQ